MSVIVVPQGSKKREVEELCGEVLDKAFSLPGLRELNALCIIMAAEKKDVRVSEFGCIMIDRDACMDLSVEPMDIKESDNVALVEVD